MSTTKSMSRSGINSDNNKDDGWMSKRRTSSNKSSSFSSDESLEGEEEDDDADHIREYDIVQSPLGPHHNRAEEMRGRKHTKKYQPQLQNKKRQQPDPSNENDNGEIEVGRKISVRFFDEQLYNGVITKVSATKFITARWQNGEISHNLNLDEYTYTLGGVMGRAELKEYITNKHKPMEGTIEYYTINDWETPQQIAAAFGVGVSELVTDNEGEIEHLSNTSKLKKSDL